MSLAPARRLLFIRRDNIGDMVCTTPLFAAARAHHPDALIAVFTNDYVAPVLEGNPDIDRVYEYGKAKHGAGRAAAALGVVRVLARMRRERFDAIVAADRRAVGFARWLGARRVISFAFPGWKSAGVTDAVPADGIEGLSETEIAWRLGGPLGLAGEPGRPKVVPRADALEAARRAIAAQRWREPGPLVGLHVSARKPSQRWPIERFAELARALHSRDGARFMLFWAPGAADNPTHPGDDDKAAALIAACADLPMLAWPTTALHELVGAIAACDRMVMSDGGALHIASALGRPVVAFFGQSDAARWRPWRATVEVLQPPSRDANHVTLAEVLAAYDRLP